MSVYRRDGAKTYSYDFRWRGHRFSGSTGETDKRRAEAWEKAEKQRIKTVAIDPRKPMTFGVATTMYWTEIGQFHRNSVDTERSGIVLHIDESKPPLLSLAELSLSLSMEYGVD